MATSCSIHVVPFCFQISQFLIELLGLENRKTLRALISLKLHFYLTFFNFTVVLEINFCSFFMILFKKSGFIFVRFEKLSLVIINYDRSMIIINYHHFLIF
jgi:hypothetical protein